MPCRAERTKCVVGLGRVIIDWLINHHYSTYSVGKSPCLGTLSLAPDLEREIADIFHYRVVDHVADEDGESRNS